MAKSDIVKVIVAVGTVVIDGVKHTVGKEVEAVRDEVKHLLDSGILVEPSSATVVTPSDGAPTVKRAAKQGDGPSATVVTQ